MPALKLAVDNTAPMARLKVETRRVTPKLAHTWLKSNHRNRRISPSVVASYARDMEAGHWLPTGEAVKFDTNGDLADGQHRLSAVVASGCTVEMLVVHGVLPEAQTIMDSGKKRSANDALVLVGQSNPSILAAAARFALREPAAGFVETRTVAPTNSEIAVFIDDHPTIHRAAELASHFYPAFDAPPSVLALAWMRFSSVDIEAAHLFFDSVANMSTGGQGDPRSTLVRRLQSARRGGERLSQSTYLSMIFRAWNAWREGRSLSKLPIDTRHGFIKAPDVVR